MPKPKVTFVQPRDQRNFPFKGANKELLKVRRKVQKGSSYNALRPTVSRALRAAAIEAAKKMTSEDQKPRLVTLCEIKHRKSHGCLTATAKAVIAIAA